MVRKSLMVLTAAVSVLMVGAGPAVAQVGWTAETTVNPGNFDQLLAVSCVTQADCVAVGRYTPGGTTQASALAEHWDGSAWTSEPVPAPASGFVSLDEVSCGAAASCVALGSYILPGTSPPKFRALGERWDGASWHRIPVAAGLDVVSCPAAGTCIAVGQQGKKLVAAEWDGSSWTTLPAPAPVPAGTGAFNSISCTSAAACTAAGEYDTTPASIQALAERWNGRTWALQATAPATSGELHGVSCVSASVCTAVGTGVTASGRGVMAERWAGGTWTVQPTPQVPATVNILTSVSCSSVRSCTAVGVREGTLGGQYMMALHWNGTRWTRQAPLPGYDLVTESVSCQRGTGCTAAGFIQDNLYGQAPQTALAAHTT